MKTTICHSDIQNKTNKCVAADLPSAATTFENNTGKASPVYSFSKIKTFYTCKYQYYMNYVLPIEQRPKKHENAFAQYGSFVHEILEKFFSGELAEFELTDYYAENFDIAVREEFPPNSFVDLGQAYYNDGYCFLEAFEGIQDYKIIGVEKEFTTRFNDGQESFFFRGIIDLILQDKQDGSIVIQDWKSKSRFKNRQEQKEYARQLYLYAKHIKEEFGKWPTMLRFSMFRKGNVINIPFRMEDYEEAVVWASTCVKQIESCKQWPPTLDEWYCSQLCDFRDGCDFGKQIKTEYLED